MVGGHLCTLNGYGHISSDSMCCSLTSIWIQYRQNGSVSCNSMSNARQHIDMLMFPVNWVWWEPCHHFKGGNPTSQRNHFPPSCPRPPRASPRTTLTPNFVTTLTRPSWREPTCAGASGICRNPACGSCWESFHPKIFPWWESLHQAGCAQDELLRWIARANSDSGRRHPTSPQLQFSTWILSANMAICPTSTSGPKEMHGNTSLQKSNLE